MAEKSDPVANIDSMSRLVETALKRATTPLPPALIAQASALIRYCLRHHLAGNPAHPGLARMARMGKCSERHARRNLRVMEAWGMLHAVCYQKGGRWATRYWMDIDGLKRALIALGCNPSRQLVVRMEQSWADIRPDRCPDAMSAGIQYINPTQKRWCH